MYRKETLNNSSPDKFQIKVPGYSIPIFVGLSYNFPGEVIKENPRLVAEKISNISPVMVSLNELSDLGVSADKKLQNARQKQITPLLTLSNQIRNLHEQRKEIFSQKYPSFEKSFAAIENDFLLLSRRREEFSSGEYPDNCQGYLELDSGIIEAGYIEHALPGVLTNHEIIDITEPVNSIDELKNKYGIFLLGANNRNGNSNTVKQIRSMHGLMMAAKVDDDKEGIKTDRLLGMPNLTELENCDTNGSTNSTHLKDLKDEYVRIAGQGKIPPRFLYTVLFAMDIKGKIKDRKSAGMHQPTDDIYYVAKHLKPEGFPENSNTLRHELESSGVLHQLFS